MSNWKVTWFDGTQLREVIVYSDAYNVVTTSSGQGVNTWSILKIERMPE